MALDLVSGDLVSGRSKVRLTVGTMSHHRGRNGSGAEAEGRGSIGAPGRSQPCGRVGRVTPYAKSRCRSDRDPCLGQTCRASAYAISADSSWTHRRRDQVVSDDVLIAAAVRMSRFHADTRACAAISNPLIAFDPVSTREDSAMTRQAEDKFLPGQRGLARRHRGAYVLLRRV